jgi:3-deoxy-7-phosphoheptulonate synthase
MLVLLQNNITEDEKHRIFSVLEIAGLEFLLDLTKNPPVLKISGDCSSLPKEKLEVLSGVEQVIDLDQSYRLVSRDHKTDDTVIKIGDLTIGGEIPVIIAGPCAVENEQQITEIALKIKAEGVKLMRGGAFKPRTSPYSFSGLEEEGLKLLKKAKDVTGIYIVTEVLDAGDVDLVAEYSDILQVGSRNMQNFKLLRAVGRTNMPVLLKRGMSAKVDEFMGSAEHIMTEGNGQIILCERGIRTFVEYTRNTLDLSVVPVIKKISHLPIIVDPSHGTGRSDLIEPMSLAALSAGAHGIMIEVHPNPNESWSDPEQALSLDQFSLLMEKVNQFIEWRKYYADKTPAS